MWLNPKNISEQNGLTVLPCLHRAVQNKFRSMIINQILTSTFCSKVSTWAPNEQLNISLQKSKIRVTIFACSLGIQVKFFFSVEKSRDTFLLRWSMIINHAVSQFYDLVARLGKQQQKKPIASLEGNLMIEHLCQDSPLNKILIYLVILSL